MSGLVGRVPRSGPGMGQRPGAVLMLLLACSPVIAQNGAQQIADPDFSTRIAKPAYTTTHPVVMLDEAHANFHTASGRYKPFAELLRADGYRVISGTERFTDATLRAAQVLVIANALGSPINAANATDPPPAFADSECDAVRDWVRAGGSLLLVADHAPFGAAAATLASRFGVEMGKGYAWIANGDRGPSTTIAYSRENGLLGAHPITRGVTRVVAFTGQSLSVPPGAAALLTLGSAAYESPGANADGDIAAFRKTKQTTARSVTGRAQGLALDYGTGRVVIMGEAAMFSAQIARFRDPGGTLNEIKMGMNVAGNDNRQFLLNTLHWLTRFDDKEATP